MESKFKHADVEIMKIEKKKTRWLGPTISYKIFETNSSFHVK